MSDSFSSTSSLRINEHLAYWFPTLMIAAAFGPYIGGFGFKFEHVIVYGIAFILLLSGPWGDYRNPWGVMSGPMTGWTVFLLVQCVGLWWRTAHGLGEASPSKVIASFEHHVQPIVVVATSTIMIGNLHYEKQKQAFDRALNILVLALCINSILILLSLMTGLLALFGPWLPPQGLEDDSVWRLSIEMGRYGGIFNQPFEAGLTYSFGLLGWVYLSQKKIVKPSDYIKLLLILLGGAISVSKVFILVGLPLMLIFTFISRCIRHIFLNRRALFCLGVGIVLIINLSLMWSGLDFFLRLFQPQSGQDLIDLYTANRFGQTETQVKEYFVWIFNHSPIVGIGFSPFDVIDNEFLLVFASAGFLGILLFVSFIIAIFKIIIHNFPVKRSRYLAGSMVALMLGASMGAPAFTINRGALVFWSLFSWLCLMENNLNKEL